MGREDEGEFLRDHGNRWPWSATSPIASTVTVRCSIKRSRFDAAGITRGDRHKRFRRSGLAITLAWAYKKHLDKAFPSRLFG